MKKTMGTAAGRRDSRRFSGRPAQRCGSGNGSYAGKRRLGRILLGRRVDCVWRRHAAAGRFYVGKSGAV